jgi:muramidase (phage lysozyme)
VDLDGLEAYYSTDGTFIKQLGSSTKVFAVQAENASTVKELLMSYEEIQNNKTFFHDAKMLQINTMLSVYSKEMPLTVEELNVRVFLNVLRRTEGHGYKAKQPYNAMYPNTTFSDYSKHPAAPKEIGAGAYGIMGQYWSTYQKRSNLQDFSPKSQDIAAVSILNSKGALDFIKKGDFKSALSLEKMKKAWTSLPGGQEEGKGISMETVNGFIKDFTAEEIQNKSELATPPGQLTVNPPSKIKK